MATTAEQVRSYPGIALLSRGFRPSFLVGAIWSALVVAIWLPLLAGSLSLPIALSPIEWHAHELLYGYLPAIAAGFLLTAVPNWTGRLPVAGPPLLGLLRKRRSKNPSVKRAAATIIFMCSESTCL